MAVKKRATGFIANSKWYLKNFRSNTIMEFSKNRDVVCFSPEDSSIALQVRHIPIDLNAYSVNFYREARSFLSVFNSIRKSKVKIVFSFNPKTNLYALISCYFLSTPIVINISGLGSASKLTGITGVVYKILFRFFLNKAEYVFFQNNIDRDICLTQFLLSTDRSEVLPGSGVDLEKFSFSSEINSSRTFLMAARLINEKGVVEYLNASELVSKIYSNVGFKLAGVLDYSDRAVPHNIISHYEAFSWFEYLGMRADIDQVLKEVDCVVLPSYYPEGTPRSLLEAAASGKVIITTDTPGCRDVVIEGVNGFLVPPRDTEALKEAMEKVINLSDEKLAEMQANSRKLAEEKYDEQYVIQRYLDVAEEILAKKSKK
ncbi:glycosyltransferase family 4 protein [Cobetia marina]|uniref:glycosyltransferase family 4 protein n=1 Tax=Cobetia marina TaxID=28258 RepID=UPI000A0680F9|nr:glycosyltransferase family 4 protein [Cobetia marina]